MRPVRRFRLWLLALCLVFGQVATLVHAAEHLDAAETQHVCLDCLAGHDLGGAPPPAASSAPVATASYAFPLRVFVPVLTVRLVAGRRARGPPNT